MKILATFAYYILDKLGNKTKHTVEAENELHAMEKIVEKHPDNELYSHGFPRWGWWVGAVILFTSIYIYL